MAWTTGSSFVRARESMSRRQLSTHRTKRRDAGSLSTTQKTSRSLLPRQANTGRLWKSWRTRWGTMRGSTWTRRSASSSSSWRQNNSQAASCAGSAQPSSRPCRVSSGCRKKRAILIPGGRIDWQASHGAGSKRTRACKSSPRNLVCRRQSAYHALAVSRPINAAGSARAGYLTNQDRGGVPAGQGHISGRRGVSRDGSGSGRQLPHGLTLA